MMATGDCDLCYFNFMCAQPHYIGSVLFLAFNNILSNIGYLVFGALFVVITFTVSVLQELNKVCKNLPENSLCSSRYLCISLSAHSR